MKNCAVCGSKEKLQVCSNCKRKWYCSKAHQIQDWKVHKKICAINLKVECKFVVGSRVSLQNIPSSWDKLHEGEPAEVIKNLPDGNVRVRTVSTGKMYSLHSKHLEKTVENNLPIEKQSRSNIQNNKINDVIEQTSSPIHEESLSVMRKSVKQHVKFNFDFGTLMPTDLHFLMNITSINNPELVIPRDIISSEGLSILGSMVLSNTIITQIILPSGKTISIQEFSGDTAMFDYIGYGKYSGIIISSFLKCNSTLTHMNLLRNNIGDIGAHEIGEALKQNSTLTKLELHCNHIGDVGAQGLADGLKQNYILIELDISRNIIQDIGAKAICDALKINSVLTSLDMRRNSLIGMSGIDEIRNTLMVTENIQIFGGIPIPYIKSSDGNTTECDLSYSSFKDTEAGVLAELMMKNVPLIDLNLRKNKIGDIGSKYIAEGLKTNSILTILLLGNNKIGSGGGKALAEALKKNSTVINIELHNNNIKDIGAEAFGDTLKENTTLTILNLGSNNFGDIGAQKLGDALKVNTTLTKIYLMQNKIDEDGLNAIVSGLRKNKTLKKIYLMRNRYRLREKNTLLDEINEHPSITTYVFQL